MGRSGGGGCVVCSVGGGFVWRPLGRSGKCCPLVVECSEWVRLTVRQVERWLVLAEWRRRARGGAARGKEEERKAGRWGLYPLRRLVTPFESVRLLPLGGYSQVGEGGKRREVGVGKY